MAATTSSIFAVMTARCVKYLATWLQVLNDQLVTYGMILSSISFFQRRLQ
jgi:hypothetical protein